MLTVSTFHRDHSSNNLLDGVGGVDDADVVLDDCGTKKNSSCSGLSRNRPPTTRHPSDTGTMDSFTSPSPLEVVTQRKVVNAHGEPMLKTIGNTMKKEFA